MNLRLRRLGLGPSSRHRPPYHVGQTAASYDAMCVGSADLLHAARGAYGTFLLLRDVDHGSHPSQVRALVESEAQEVCKSSGGPVQYPIADFTPGIQNDTPHCSEDTHGDNSDVA